MIAGHDFAGMDLRCDCGKSWSDISATTKADIGKPRIAHYGVLNEQEYAEIEAERERIWQTIKQSV